MIFWQKHNLAFLHINRTGGSSITRVLINNFGFPDEGSTLSKYSGGDGRIHEPLEIRLMELPDLDLNNLTIYANIRNPFDRIVSIWARMYQQKKTEMSFERYFYNRYVPGKPTKVGITMGAISDFVLVGGKVLDNVRIIKFEDDFVEQWKGIIKSHSGDDLNIPHQTESEHGEGIKYFDREMADFVRDKEHWVIENYYRELING